MLIKKYSTIFHKNKELESKVTKLTLNVEKLLQQKSVVGQNMVIDKVLFFVLK